ncbi:hypothetical protein UNDKW_4255 [Undibacterium sp. KW1]|uniref:hypothetical protein n=1 Tax=Undibacterium sp. KW1 TaxID=2058624 RepID=UPI001331C966|nr:hypothetical protein [Undibacterium sp. KW1]BBB62528.1 hypothetical protein UNDKW_4255 [Undibacterium sp. KW1]
MKNLIRSCASYLPAGLMLACLSACSTVPPNPVVLFKAAIYDIRPGPPYPKSTKPNTIDFTSYFWVDFMLQENLIGHVEDTRGPALLWAWHMPWEGHWDKYDFYVLARQDKEGKLQTVWWSFAIHGFCVDQELAQELDIQSEMQALYQSGKLACSVLDKLGYDLPTMKKKD